MDFYQIVNTIGIELCELIMAQIIEARMRDKYGNSWKSKLYILIKKYKIYVDEHPKFEDKAKGAHRSYLNDLPKGCTEAINPMDATLQASILLFPLEDKDKLLNEEDEINCIHKIRIVRNEYTHSKRPKKELWGASLTPMREALRVFPDILSQEVKERVELYLDGRIESTRETTEEVRPYSLTITDARRMLKEGDGRQGVELLERLANEEENAEAMIRLSRIYRIAEFPCVEEDLSKAFMYIRTAVDLGDARSAEQAKVHLEAMNEVQVIQEQAETTSNYNVLLNLIKIRREESYLSRDSKKIVELYRKARDLGYANSVQGIQEEFVRIKKKGKEEYQEIVEEWYREKEVLAVDEIVKCKAYDKLYAAIMSDVKLQGSEFNQKIASELKKANRYEYYVYELLCDYHLDLRKTNIKDINRVGVQTNTAEQIQKICISFLEDRYSNQVDQQIITNAQYIVGYCKYLKDDDACLDEYQKFGKYASIKAEDNPALIQALNHYIKIGRTRDLCQRLYQYVEKPEKKINELDSYILMRLKQAEAYEYDLFQLLRVVHPNQINLTLQKVNGLNPIFEEVERLCAAVISGKHSNEALSEEMVVVHCICGEVKFLGGKKDYVNELSSAYQYNPSLAQDKITECLQWKVRELTDAIQSSVSCIDETQSRGCIQYVQILRVENEKLNGISIQLSEVKGQIAEFEKYGISISDTIKHEIQVQEERIQKYCGLVIPYMQEGKKLIPYVRTCNGIEDRIRVIKNKIKKQHSGLMEEILELQIEINDALNEFANLKLDESNMNRVLLGYKRSIRQRLLESQSLSRENHKLYTKRTLLFAREVLKENQRIFTWLEEHQEMTQEILVQLDQYMKMSLNRDSEYINKNDKAVRELVNEAIEANEAHTSEWREIIDVSQEISRLKTLNLSLMSNVQDSKKLADFRKQRANEELRKQKAEEALRKQKAEQRKREEQEKREEAERQKEEKARIQKEKEESLRKAEDARLLKAREESLRKAEEEQKEERKRKELEEKQKIEKKKKEKKERRKERRKERKEKIKEIFTERGCLLLILGVIVCGVNFLSMHMDIDIANNMINTVTYYMNQAAIEEYIESGEYLEAYALLKEETYLESAEEQRVEVLGLIQEQVYEVYPLSEEYIETEEFGITLGEDHKLVLTEDFAAFEAVNEAFDYIEAVYCVSEALFYGVYILDDEGDFYDVGAYSSAKWDKPTSKDGYTLLAENVIQALVSKTFVYVQTEDLQWCLVDALNEEGDYPWEDIEEVISSDLFKLKDGTYGQTIYERNVFTGFYEIEIPEGRTVVSSILNDYFLLTLDDGSLMASVAYDEESSQEMVELLNESFETFTAGVVDVKVADSGETLILLEDGTLWYVAKNSGTAKYYAKDVESITTNYVYSGYGETYESTSSSTADMRNLYIVRTDEVVISLEGYDDYVEECYENDSTPLGIDDIVDAGGQGVVFNTGETAVSYSKASEVNSSKDNVAIIDDEICTVDDNRIIEIFE